MSRSLRQDVDAIKAALRLVILAGGPAVPNDLRLCVRAVKADYRHTNVPPPALPGLRRVQWRQEVVVGLGWREYWEPRGRKPWTWGPRRTKGWYIEANPTRRAKSLP